MLDFNICIPSKGRPYKSLVGKIFTNAIWYVPESEVYQYREFYKNVIGVPNQIRGITATRNFILKDNKSNVFFIDDDLEYGGFFIRDKTKYKIQRVIDESIYLNEISKLFELANQTNAKLIGFFTAGNNLGNYPMNPFLLNGVCLGSCMGIINDGTYYFNEDYEVKEDYELTLRNLKDERLLIRSNILFMQHEHTQKSGGCRDSNRLEKEKKAILKLVKEYPGAIKQAKHRGTSFAIQLNI